MDYEAFIQSLDESPSKLSFNSELQNVSSISRGQVRLVGEKDSGLAVREVLILGVDKGEGFCDVLLTHPFVEAATGTDLIVSREVDSVPYSLVIQTDCRGIVWSHELGEVIGMLSNAALSAVDDVERGGFPEGDGYSRGLKIRGFFDDRWTFKEREGEIIQSLASNCTAHVLGISVTFDELFERIVSKLEDRNPSIENFDSNESIEVENQCLELGMGKGFGSNYATARAEMYEPELTLAA